MKAIMIMFDSLNRRYLPPYGCDWVHAPNFQRLAQRAATFESSWVCSMPCMPARRDFHTARPNFFHAGWEPLQPWDDSVPEMLKRAGISTHLATDHYHYFADTGGGYNTRYSTWQNFRGQEADPWIGQVAEPVIPPTINRRQFRENWVNRPFSTREDNCPQTLTTNAGLDFIERNHGEDRWFLQIEMFDPHEPFTTPEAYQKLYKHAGENPIFDLPDYADVTETPEEVERARHNYAALLSQCDANLGRILDAIDKHDLWKDTMVIVWTDHGYLLGEHNRFAKNIPTMWNEIANTPFFVWDPRFPDAKGVRRSALVQPAIDLGPTLLRLFGLEPTADMTGCDLAPVVEHDTPVREDAVFGYFGLPVHYTDGRYVYMRKVVDAKEPIYTYTWTPHRFNGETEAVELYPPLPFTKNMQVIRRRHEPPAPKEGEYQPPTGMIQKHLLYDLETDSGQSSPIDNPQKEQAIVERLSHHMKRCHAPEEMFVRYGIPF